MNQPFDQTVKLFAEDDPRGFLYLFAGVPLDAPVSIEPIERELQIAPHFVDHAYHLREQGREWICHFEAQTRYRSDLPERLARYGSMLWLIHNKPVETTLLLLAEEHAPRVVPQEYTIDAGGLLLRVRFHVVKLWELDAAIALEPDRPTLLPWVMAMRASGAQIAEAVRRLKGIGHEHLISDSLTIARLRYDKNNPEWFVERLSRMFERALEELRQEPEHREFLMAVCETHFRQEEVRKLIRRVAALRFPALGDLPELDSVIRVAALESLHDRLVTAPDVASAQAAIREITTDPENL